MKRIIYYFIALLFLVGSSFSCSLSKSSDLVDVIVLGSSDTGYSWTRMYAGPEDQLDVFAQNIRDSYLRLAESMNAGSNLKILVRDELIAHAEHEGESVAPYSGIQIVVHDRFASQLNYHTSDRPPGLLSEMENPQEPFVCGGQE